MEVVEFIRAQVKEVHFWLSSVMEELPDNVAAWQPEGTANRIEALLAHMTMTQDNAVNRAFKGGETIFETGGFAARTGIPTGRGAIWGHDWHLNIEGMREYRALVQASADDFLASITASDLDREVPWAGGMRDAWYVIKQPLLNHLLLHTGEVSVLKGIQGLKGLPT